MEGTIFSLIPALLMLGLVLITRKVILSLGAGIIVGVLIIHDFNPLLAIKEIGIVFIQIFVTSDGINLGSIYLLSFLLFLGITTAFLTASGGSKAFGEWAMNKVRTRKQAQIFPILLGFIIFIDDYFNSLAVGQVARPITDRHRISRAKLSYFIDSTSAPITVISPISSWGAFIIGTIGGILQANNLTEYQALYAFVQMIPSNFYALASLLLVLLVAVLNINIGPMKKHETKAMLTGELYDKEKGGIALEMDETISPNENGKIFHLIIPIATLIVGTVGAMIITGVNNSGQAGLLAIFENTNVNLSLFWGGLLAVVISFILFNNQKQPRVGTFKISWEGIKAMLPAIYILIFAWMIGSVIDQLGTGVYLAERMEHASISGAFVPLLLFLVASFMALATGTSWGTFGIMLPIAAQISVQTDVTFVLPAMAAVLAGSVFGDHCSPISDTTILSSTGAGANHIDHVLTQLPYAVIGAIAATIGYLILGISNHIILSLLVTLIIIVVIAVVINQISNKNK